MKDQLKFCSMYIVKVVPVKRIPRGIPQILSYFSSKKMESGFLVMIKIRNKDILAIVLSCDDARNKRIEIKKSDFELKPIVKTILPQPIFTREQLNLIFWISEYFIEPISYIIRSAVPRIPARVEIQNKRPADEEIVKHKRNKPLLVISPDTSHTLSHIINKIKQVLERGEQVFILAAEIEAANKISNLIKDFFYDSEVLTINRKSSIKKTWMEYVSIGSGKVRIIIGTRTAVFLPFFKLGLVIITDEHSDSHKQWEGHPLYDARDIAVKMSEMYDADLLLESCSPTVSSYWKAKNNFYDMIDLSEKKGKTDIEIVSMKDEQKKGNYGVYSDYFIDKLKKIITSKKKALLFLNRKGAANFIICKTCGNIAKCPICQIPLVLYSNNDSIDPKKKNKMICNHCGFSAELPKLCSKCKGSEIKYYGLGTQKAENELKKFFPSANIIRVDTDSLENMDIQRDLLKSFLLQDHGIIIGTQQIFSTKQIPDLAFVGVISMDAMLAIPDYRTDEKAFTTVLKLHNMCNDMAIQTYNPDQPLIKSFKSLDYGKFAEKEFANRKMLFYPPFSTIIKLSLKSADFEKGQREMQIISDELNKKLKNYINNKCIKMSKPVPAFLFHEKGIYNWHIILKIKNEEIIESPRNEKLFLNISSLLSGTIPRNWNIDVNPQSLL